MTTDSSDGTNRGQRQQRLRRETWLFRIRLHFIIGTISALNLENTVKERGFEGDATTGRAYEHDGSGNHIASTWSEAGVVVLGFDHDFGRFPREDFLGELPDDLKALGEKVFDWLPPASDVAWFSVRGDQGGKNTMSDRLNQLVADEAKMLAAWGAYYSISPAQLELARALAAAPARRALTADEVALLRAKPGGASDAPAAPEAPLTPAEQAIEDQQLARLVAHLVATERAATEEEARAMIVRKPPLGAAAEALARRQLGDAGIDWT